MRLLVLKIDRLVDRSRTNRCRLAAPHQLFSMAWKQLKKGKNLFIQWGTFITKWCQKHMSGKWRHQFTVVQIEQIHNKSNIATALVVVDFKNNIFFVSILFLSQIVSLRAGGANRFQLLDYSY